MKVWIIALLAAGAGLLSAAPVYTWTEIGAGNQAEVIGLSSHGAATGAYAPNGPLRAWRNDGGVFTDLGTLGGGMSQGFAINASGEVTGFSSTPNGLEFAFLYSGSIMTSLGALGGTNSLGFGINNNGWVTGYAFNTGDTSYQAFLYRNGAMSGLGTLGGGGSAGYAINSSGWVAGMSYLANGQQHAMLHDGTAMLDLGTLGGTYGTAKAISDNGYVAGYSLTASGEMHAFLYTSGGGMQDLGTLGGGYAEARGVNGQGWVTGYSWNGVETRAFLYDGVAMRDLNGLNFTTALPTVLYRADGINDAGQIIANGYDGRAYLLTPEAAVPEPSTMALAGVALILAGLIRRRGDTIVG